MRFLAAALAAQEGLTVRSSLRSGRECPTATAPVAAGVPAGLEEASGLALSAVEPGRLYSMNDTPLPEGPHVFALGKDGVVDAAFTLDLQNGTHPFGKTGLGDWEGLAVGPCGVGAAESCLFLGDTGHNCAREECPYHRDWYRVLRIKEQDLRGQELVPAEEIWFQFPSGAAYDAEVLLSHPTGAVFVLTKQNDGEAKVFSLDSCGGTPVEVKQVGSVHFPGYLVTGGSIDARGERLMLRMYKVGGTADAEADGKLLFWRLAPVPLEDGKRCGGRARAAARQATDNLVRALDRPGCVLPTAPEPQGEGCAFLPGSRASDPPIGYATISEQGAPLHVATFGSGVAAVLLGLLP